MRLNMTQRFRLWENVSNRDVNIRKWRDQCIDEIPQFYKEILTQFHMLTRQPCQDFMINIPILNLLKQAKWFALNNGPSLKLVL